MGAESETGEIATYQGTINREVSEEFKQCVSRKVNIDDKMNEVITGRTKTQNEREQRLAQLEHSDQVESLTE
ncbi:hypothetical protein [Saliphagus infecundisoli]|uniref:Uncharacterized protein n=1 Tax=Saliphagus infecundisoli TaxID=1849069 RepID=A0ABD5QHB0_9EURY|nr:hypothetical protein [Saliphagus infecundisoli]